MPQPISTADEAVLQRRRFLRSGALVAAAAGGAVAASASSVLPASAAPLPYSNALTIPVPAERLLDTRSAAGLKAIVGSSGSALDSKNRLKAHAWIDVAVATTDDESGLDLVAVIVNLKSLASTKGGSLVVAEPQDEMPTGTTVTYRKDETTTNSAFVGLGIVGDTYVVRIWATSTSHVTLDLTGAEIVGQFPTLDARTTRKAALQRVLKAVHAVQR